jgi:hypothetical protein
MPDESHEVMNGRSTYFPPFVNERFDGPPYWACTFAALLNGVNVGYLGRKPASHVEIQKLALASGDDQLKGGSRASHMLTAMKVRYGERLSLEQLRPELAQERLANGWALVAGVTYGALPNHHRRWSRNFYKGHRVTLVGWTGRSTRILDPMANEGPEYHGENIAWSEFEPAWWSGEQLWFAEGMFLPGPRTEVIEQFPARRRLELAAGSPFRAISARRPRVTIRRTVPGDRVIAAIDAVVMTVDPAGARHGPYLRIVSGGLAGTLVPADTRGLKLDRTTTAGIAKLVPRDPARPNADKAPAKAPAAGPVVDDQIPADPVQAFEAGRKQGLMQAQKAVAAVG